MDSNHKQILNNINKLRIFQHNIQKMDLATVFITEKIPRINNLKYIKIHIKTLAINNIMI